MIFEICAIIATIIFIGLGFYIIQTLKVVQFSLKNLNESVNNLEIEAASLKLNANQLLISSNETMEKINGKLDDISPLVHLFSNVGDAGNEAVRHFESKKRHYFAEEEEEQRSDWQDKIVNLVELANLGIKIFQKNKKRN